VTQVSLEVVDATRRRMSEDKDAMSQVKDDPFAAVSLELESETTDFSELSRRTIAPPAPAGLPSAARARLHGFDLGDRPLIVGVPGLPHEIVPAQTTVPLQQAHIGATVVVMFDEGDLWRPIVVGVLQESRTGLAGAAAPAPRVQAQVDDQRLVLTAEREIVLQCGEASITLTRAGKIVIKGTYVVSRSSGPNRIKGASVDIN
jgi:uncharacterized protein DUF6484